MDVKSVDNLHLMSNNARRHASVSLICMPTQIIQHVVNFSKPQSDNHVCKQVRESIYKNNTRAEMPETNDRINPTGTPFLPPAFLTLSASPQHELRL